MSGVSKQEGKNTATYVAVESHSEDKSVDPLIVAIAETDIIDSIDPNLVSPLSLPHSFLILLFLLIS